MTRIFGIALLTFGLSACASNGIKESPQASRGIASRGESECEVSSPAGTSCSCKVSHLHPTQLAVGMRSVEEKEEKVHKNKKADKLDEYLAEHPEPTVIGPRGKLYIIDHHHLGRALYNQDIKRTYCEIRENFSNMDIDSFWAAMNSRAWVYPYDEDGKGPLPYSEIPDSVGDLKDDPYRSLAAAVRDAGGYQKTPTPFAEFQWANFFRTRIEKHDVKKDFECATERGVDLAHSPEASSLPGYQPR